MSRLLQERVLHDHQHEVDWLDAPDWSRCACNMPADATGDWNWSNVWHILFLQPDWWQRSNGSGAEPAAANGTANASGADAQQQPQQPAGSQQQQEQPQANGGSDAQRGGVVEASEAGSWTAPAVGGVRRPGARYEHAVARLGGHMFVVGGNCGEEEDGRPACFRCSVAMTAMQLWCSVVVDLDSKSCSVFQNLFEVKVVHVAWRYAGVTLQVSDTSLLLLAPLDCTEHIQTWQTRYDFTLSCAGGWHLSDTWVLDYPGRVQMHYPINDHIVFRVMFAGGRYLSEIWVLDLDKLTWTPSR